jgi:hypothetical protein
LLPDAKFLWVGGVDGYSLDDGETRVRAWFSNFGQVARCIPSRGSGMSGLMAFTVVVSEATATLALACAADCPWKVGMSRHSVNEVVAMHTPPVPPPPPPRSCRPWTPPRSTPKSYATPKSRAYLHIKAQRDEA